MEYNVQFSSQNDKVSTDVNVQGGKTFALHLFKTGHTLEAAMQSNEQELDASFSSMQVVGSGGSDGFSPIVDVEPIEGGHRLTITDAKGTETADIMDGQDGISPVVSVEDIDGGHRITITDKDGEKTFDVMDGKDGTGGSGGAAELPSGQVPYQHLVTNADGEIVWKDLDYCFVRRNVVFFSGTIATYYDSTYGVYLGNLAFNNLLPFTPNEITVFFDSQAYDHLAIQDTIFGRTTGNLSMLNSILGTNYENTGEPFIIAGITAGGCIVTSNFFEVEFHHYQIIFPEITDDILEIRHHDRLPYAGSGLNAESFNNNNSASGDYSHSEGRGTLSRGISSHSEGSKTVAVGNDSHAEGRNTSAAEECSHAEGCGTAANGKYAHAEGLETSANGVASHSEGFQTRASGDYSHAEGEETYANHRSQHVQGRFNIYEEFTYQYQYGRYAHIVGNGASESERSNAHTLDWNGVPWYQGRPQFGGVEQDNGAQTVMANGDAEIILKSPNGSLWGITVSDDGTLTVTAK